MIVENLGRECTCHHEKLGLAETKTSEHRHSKGILEGRAAQYQLLFAALKTQQSFEKYPGQSWSGKGKEGLVTTFTIFIEPLLLQLIFQNKFAKKSKG